MLIIICLLLMLRVGHNQTFVTKVAGVGENVILTCTHEISLDIETFFWIKLVLGNLPEILGRAYSFNYEDGNVISRIITKQEPGRFHLNITKSKLSDSGFYYCLKQHDFNISFLKGTFLRIKDAEPDVTAIIQDFPAAPVLPGDSVTLQCSVLFDSGEKTCSEDHRVSWFRIRSDESHPVLIYVHGNSGDQCKRSPEAHSPQTCVYSFSKNISSSDAGTYYCAVATCGQIIFGNGTKLNIGVVRTCDTQKDHTLLLLLCVALAIGLVVIAFLVYALMKTSYDCCYVAATSDNQQSQQRNEDTLVYHVPKFTSRTTGKAGRRNAVVKEETVYTDVRDFVIINNPNVEYNN